MIVSRKHNGVTLIELLVVMSIITMLMGVMGLVVISVGGGINEKRARTDMHKLSMVLESYRYDCGQYPEASNTVIETGIFNEINNMSFSQLVWALGSTYKGWGNPQLWHHFTIRRNTNARMVLQDWQGGSLVDPWSRAYIYIAHTQYAQQNAAKTGAAYYNPGSYQIISLGPDGAAYTNLGLDPGHLNNWSGMVD